MKTVTSWHGASMIPQRESPRCTCARAAKSEIITHARPLAEDDRTSPTVSTPHFVGRDREMAALRGALARPPAIVLVEGEAGIGKSRLLREWLAAPDQRTALVSVCPPLRESLTLGPIVDAFRGIDRPVSRLRLTELAGALRAPVP
ncbi:AAA family ATPase [Micromonospora sp. WMMD812]|uniref:AAA family ATPase n=1 Tax=Micromonospora sp. WMMD812 TaxID=3015152 RepID=UPI00248BFC5A|nr:AAA family ATPase [Micromonospora sp. WMMD812]WBB67611.1 AAA family ATPase [Micromonospora sp. WMMD812]